MELTDAQRAELESIVTAARYSRPAIDEMRGGDKATYRARRERLNDLLEAWRAIDLDTQIALSGALVRMGEEHGADGDAPVPDFGDVVAQHLAELALPSGKPEKTEGFGEAVLFLWNAWCAEQPLDREPAVGEDALASISPIIADTFGLPLSRARSRTYDRLRAFERTEDGLPRRKGYRG